MLAAIRKCFNITNISLANYSGGSHDMIKSLSSNRRLYNTALFNKVIMLYKALTLKTPITVLPHAVIFIKNEEEMVLPKLEQLLKKAQKKLSTTNDSLQRLQNNRENWLRGLHACSELLEKEDITASDTKWVHLRKSHLKIQLADNSLFKIVQLEGEIVGLKAKVISLQASIK